MSENNPTNREVLTTLQGVRDSMKALHGRVDSVDRDGDDVRTVLTRVETRLDKAIVDLERLDKWATQGNGKESMGTRMFSAEADITHVKTSLVKYKEEQEDVRKVRTNNRIMLAVAALSAVATICAEVFF